MEPSYFAHWFYFETMETSSSIHIKHVHLSLARHCYFHQELYPFGSWIQLQSFFYDELRNKTYRIELIDGDQLFQVTLDINNVLSLTKIEKANFDAIVEEATDEVFSINPGNRTALPMDGLQSAMISEVHVDAYQNIKNKMGDSNEVTY